MSERPVITVAAALIVDSTGRMLLVRKRGTRRFMQAGGKLEPGESALDACVRELEEELAVRVDRDALEPVGRFEVDAANEPGHLLRAEVFRLDSDADLQPAAELEEAAWFTAAQARALGDRLAPLARELLAYAQVRSDGRPEKPLPPG